MGDPRLLERAQSIKEFNTNELHYLIEDLWDTMHSNNGAGLAAPQIGVPLQVVVFGVASNPRYPDAPSIPETVLINPVITPISDDRENDWEGCLSLPGMRGLVPRYQRIHYSAYNTKGEFFEAEAESFHARVIQHECDHLRGILYPMQMEDMGKFGFDEELFPPADQQTGS
jgi:peptide deformylase